MTTTTNGNKLSVTAQDLADKQAIHAYLTPEAHEAWHATCSRKRVSVSAMLEALAPHLGDLLAEHPEIVDKAGEIEYQRRRRTR